MAGANLIVTGKGPNEQQFNSFYEKVLGKFERVASSMRVGSGLDETVQMGPLRDRDKKAKVTSFAEKSIKEGTKLRLDGRKLRLVGK